MALYGYILMTLFTFGYTMLAVEGRVTKLHILTYLLIMPAFAHAAGLI